MTRRDRVAELKRWEDSGAHWSVVARQPGRLTIALMTCDGGEEVDRFDSTDAAVLSFVGNRSGSMEA